MFTASFLMYFSEMHLGMFATNNPRMWGAHFGCIENRCSYKFIFLHSYAELYFYSIPYHQQNIIQVLDKAYMCLKWRNKMCK